jgi:hypothetical protein
MSRGSTAVSAFVAARTLGGVAAADEVGVLELVGETEEEDGEGL